MNYIDERSTLSMDINKDETEKEYIQRINKVIDFIEQNLDQELPLYQLAELANYSPFHFHRVFSGITGEPLNTFINRIRLERVASSLLLGEKMPISELGFKYGFNNASSLSRAFKKFYGLSPSVFKEQGKEPFSKIGKAKSKNGQEYITFEKYICSINNIKKWISMNAQIEVKEMPALNLIGIKHMGKFDEIGLVYDRLMRWAGPVGLLNNPEMKAVTIYHDDPKVTELSKVRQSACITINQAVNTEGEVSKVSTDKGRYAVGRFEIQVNEFEQAWNSMGVWVAESGYENRDAAYYELYHNDHKTHPEQKFILDICIPVK